MAEDNENEQRRRERELSEHDRITARSAAHASRDTLHDASAGQETGDYTTEQARDRAAHTPSILDRLDAPRNAQEEREMMAALDKELFPTEQARQAWERETSPRAPPQDEAERRQWQDLRQMAAAENLDSKESNTNVTPEQQANVDRALQRADLTDKIGGATDVSTNPAPNDPTPLEKSRDIGQDLHKQGVAMDKE